MQEAVKLEARRNPHPQEEQIDLAAAQFESAAPNLASMTSDSEYVLSEAASSSAGFIASTLCRNRRREIDQYTFEPSLAARLTWRAMN
jgi:hypothetical protein